MSKKCGFCGEMVGSDLTECPKCSHGVFETEKLPSSKLEVPVDSGSAADTKSKTSGSGFSWRETLMDSAIGGLFFGLAQFFLMREMHAVGYLFAAAAGLTYLVLVFLHPSLLHKFLASLGILGFGELIAATLAAVFTK